MRIAGATVITCVDFEDAAFEARKFGTEKKVRYVSPDNDPFVIAGSASAALEMFFYEGAAHGIDVFSPLVGGGTLAGMQIGADMLRAAMHIATGYPSTFVQKGPKWTFNPVVLNSPWVPAHEPSVLDTFEGNPEERSPAAKSLPMRRTEVTIEDIEDAMLYLNLSYGFNAEATAAAAFAGAMRQATKTSRDEVNVAVMAAGADGGPAYEQALANATLRAQRQELPNFVTGAD